MYSDFILFLFILYKKTFFFIYIYIFYFSKKNILIFYFYIIIFISKKKFVFNYFILFYFCFLKKNKKKIQKNSKIFAMSNFC